MAQEKMELDLELPPGSAAAPGDGGGLRRSNSAPLIHGLRKDQKLARQSKDLLLKLRSKMEIHSQWEQGHVAWEEYRDTVRMSGDGIRKAKAQMEKCERG
ncbi:hypothetical protein HGM15179_020217 [Zosterops borbonicus]|uniref:Uncharacterized protein n=1 Tax=Zosterops borbonicus TaxID=364589 RepID=A0A8K1FYI3_9PASS|nr:hypothetical protein HGM15179_020217 [Zosterops borbonicus]